MDFYSLKNSILFNISLQSKELFHSNFLGYLFEKYPDIFFSVIGEEQIKITEIKRESNNTDILIFGEKNYVIENKIKDIAKMGQLKKISDKILQKKKSIENFYLFSLLGDNVKDKENSVWKEIGYTEIVSVLEEYNYNDEYLSLIVKDYCCFVKILISSLENIFSDCTKYIFYAYDNERYDNFKEIRMHDLFLKHGMSLYLQYFNDNFNKDNSIITNYGINHARPSMDFRIEKDDLDVLIQVEDLEYRYAVECREDQLAYFENIGWFDPEWRSPKGLKYRTYKRKDTNTSGKMFYYQFEILNKDEDFDKLSKKIIKDINTMIN